MRCKALASLSKCKLTSEDNSNFMISMTQYWDIYELKYYFPCIAKFVQRCQLRQIYQDLSLSTRAPYLYSLLPRSCLGP
jgi:hypothetical protein